MVLYEKLLKRSRGLRPHDACGCLSFCLLWLHARNDALQTTKSIWVFLVPFVFNVTPLLTNGWWILISILYLHTFLCIGSFFFLLWMYSWLDTSLLVLLIVQFNLFQTGGMHIDHKLFITLTVFRMCLTKSNLFRVNEIPTFIVIIMVGI